MPVDRITALTSVMVLPWVLKFLWAPLVDVLQSPRFTLRGFIVVAQLVMAATLAPLAWIDLSSSMEIVMPLLLAHALAAATQDVAVDALAVATTDASERGSVNGFMQLGMLVGRSLFGGMALVWRASIGNSGVVLALVGWILASTALAFLYRCAPSQATGEALAGFSRSLGRALSRRVTWLGLAFAAVGGLGFEAVGAVAGPFLLDREWTSKEVGWLLGLPVVGVTIVGALVGGRLADRLGAGRVTRGALIYMFVAVLAVVTGWGDGVALVALYLGIGVFTAASYALFMDATDPRLGATQFSAYMGATNLCESAASRSVGLLTVAWGYGPAFTALGVLSLAGWPLAKLMERGIRDEAPEPEPGT